MLPPYSPGYQVVLAFLSFDKYRRYALTSTSCPALTDTMDGCGQMIGFFLVQNWPVVPFELQNSTTHSLYLLLILDFDRSVLLTALFEVVMFCC